MRLGYRAGEADATRPLVSFNEAEAHAPRIRIPWPLPRPGISIASMRPRRMRLGYAVGLARALVGRKRFNEAEAHAPRIPERPRERGVHE